MCVCSSSKTTTTTFKLKIFNYLILTLLPINKLSPIFITIYYHLTTSTPDYD